MYPAVGGFGIHIAFTAAPGPGSFRGRTTYAVLYLFSKFVKWLAMVATQGEACSSSWRIRVRCAGGRRDGLKSVLECVHAAELELETLLWTRALAGLTARRTRSSTMAGGSKLHGAVMT